MAQQSARRGQENQGFPQCFEHALGDMDQARELPYRPAAQRRIRGRTDGSIRLRDTAILKFSLARKGGVHGWKAVHDKGAQVSIAFPIEMNMRHGMPPILKLQRLGMEPSLSVDVECTLTADFFTQMRSCMNLQRVVLNQMILNQGSAPDPVSWGLPGSPLDVPNGDPWPTPPAGTIAPLTTRDVLRFGTMNGAKALRLDGKTGSLTPGKEADIIVLDATRINVAPLNQVPGAVVSLMDRTNVETVIRRRQGAQMEGAASRRPPAKSASTARGLARLAVQCRKHSAEPVQQPVRANGRSTVA